MTHDRKTAGLLKYSKQKTEQKKNDVDLALKKLIKQQGKINFNSVAEAANVTKAFLYRNPQIREQIETLRQQQFGLPSSKQVKRNTSDKSKDVIIASLRKKIKKLEEENTRLKEQRQKKLGDIYKNL